MPICLRSIVLFQKYSIRQWTNKLQQAISLSAEELQDQGVSQFTV